jgi:protein translocase SecG subunit
MKETIFTVLQIILSCVLVLAVLVQQKSGGVSGLFGGSTNVYSTKRGFDKILHYLTIVVAVLFFGLSLARLV